MRKKRKRKNLKIEKDRFIIKNNLISLCKRICDVTLSLIKLD